MSPTRSLLQRLETHLTACKSAIDEKSTDVAEAELQASERLLAQHGDCDGLQRQLGYLRLYSGEIAIQREEYEKGVELLQSAQAAFEGISPPHIAAALEAKTRLAEVALIQGAHRVAFAILAQLFNEADEAECLEARSRVLLLESYLFLTDDPPHQIAFEQLVARVHLIHDPQTMLQALGNLLTYAVQHLEPEEQAFLYERIANLEPRLGDDYEHLYRTYVAARYAHALETRWARHSRP